MSDSDEYESSGTEEEFATDVRVSICVLVHIYIYLHKIIIHHQDLFQSSPCTMMMMMMMMMLRVVTFNDFRNNFKQPLSWLKSYSMKSHHRLEEDERVRVVDDVHLLEIVIVRRVVEIEIARRAEVVGVTGMCVVVVNNRITVELDVGCGKRCVILLAK